MTGYLRLSKHFRRCPWFGMPGDRLGKHFSRHWLASELYCELQIASGGIDISHIFQLKQFTQLQTRAHFSESQETHSRTFTLVNPHRIATSTSATTSISSTSIILSFANHITVINERQQCTQAQQQRQAGPAG